jgi:hypothetical protein
MRFACATCGTIDNTATAHHAAQVAADRAPKCHACLMGHWHGRFPRRRYDPQTHGALRSDRTLEEAA